MIVSVEDGIMPGWWWTATDPRSYSAGEIG
jgi:hypothetical protein